MDGGHGIDPLASSWTLLDLETTSSLEFNDQVASLGFAEFRGSLVYLDPNFYATEKEHGT